MAILKFGDNILSYGGDLLSLDHTPTPPEGGYWIHYDTGNITPIGLDESYITDDGLLVRFIAPPYTTSIGEISIPEGVNSLEPSSLSGAAEMIKLILPSTIEMLLENCLAGTVKMSVIEIRSTTPPIMGSLGEYVGDLQNLVIYVPAEALSDYQSDESWGAYSSFI